MDDPNAQPDTPPGDGETPEDSDSKESVEVTIDTILDVLNNGTMQTTHGMMRYSSNYTFLVTMNKDDVCLPAIYKPRKGERPLWDFPDGTLYKRERATYLTSAALGWNIVPPTVIGSGDHGTGSIQFYIDHDPEHNYFNFGESLAPQLAQICLFDVLVNNADRKGGHLLLDAQGQLWGIDHGITFNEDYKLRTVIWDFAGQPIPKPVLKDVETLCEHINDSQSDIYSQFDELLTRREMGSFTRRLDHVLTTGRYPQPGSGPNYPWPAV